jgi:hypothetical protein
LLNVSIIKITRTKTRKGRRGRSFIERRRTRHTLVRNGTQTALHPTPTTKDLPSLPSTSLLSSPNEQHTCLMAKKNKVRTRDTTKYTSFSDEASDDDIDYSNLFKGLDRSKVDKLTN